ncbi:MAG: Replicative DNA helicase [Candidatus Berkelbacteria bacterium Licking1014_2]|uniref:Replicative DNA helicase n=1 Tax=Candidatus Berkelbacteria bacterium Licking1014_2 TaxID=2017146 RepID=A0A554LWP7_9BACT|nr:MAG: Replicative DNA helicase [Candidatus Berkelbacteria bacterium Licking1014_2]
MAKKQESSLRIPPRSPEAEQSILGAVLLDKDAIIKVADRLLPADYYEPKHEIIWEAILKLYEKRQPIDLITLTEVLDSQKQLEQIGGASYLSELVNTVATAGHVAYYADIVRHKAILRRLIAAAGEITELGFDEQREVGEVLDLAERAVFSVSQQSLGQTFTSLKGLLAGSFERLDELQKQGHRIRGVASGFSHLDNLLSGFQPSDLIIIAGRPSMGKSSLALNFAHFAACRKKVPVGIFSLEMSKDQLVDRLIALEADVDAWKIRTASLTEEDFGRIGQAIASLSEVPIFIDDSPILNSMEARTKARRLQAEHGLGMLIIDYLQLMDSTRRSKDFNRVQEISEISRSLKALARELNVPVLALSQLSRAVESRTPKIPILADLRESGSIEQDADVVMFVYREDYYEKDTDRKNIADILVRKHRNGPIGDTELYFLPEQMRFRTMEKSQ